jgi:UDP-N-acetylmuramoylalanine--D-glutamate ligase
MNLSGQRILVIGLGKTGIASARFLARQNATVFVTDEKPVAELKDAITAIGDASVNYKFCPYSPDILSQVDMIIPSPGVPPFNRILWEAVNKKIPIFSEIELAYRFLKPPMIAITGTNGKTTTTTLLGKILEKEGKKVFVGGNIGKPLVAYVDGTQDDDYVVVEVSSFQLQWIQHFRPFISVHLNTTCDHVNYHGSFESYRIAKERIFENQEKTDLAVLNADEPRSFALAEKLIPLVQFFSTSSIVQKGMYRDQNILIHNTTGGAREEYPLDMIKLPGSHNIENVMASIIAARYCGCSTENIISAITEFKGLSHRIEFTCEKNGVAFYDDSKGTNVGAVVRAVETFSKPIILLLGGRDKEGDFDTLFPLIKAKVKELVLFGEARNRINGMIGGVVKTSIAPTLKEAIEAAYRHSSSGDIVLLSPGCASFDEFSSYKERGNFFQNVVKNL